jgi:hypothetical protein
MKSIIACLLVTAMLGFAPGPIDVPVGGIGNSDRGLGCCEI